MGNTKGMGVMPAVMTFWNEDESYNEKRDTEICSVGIGFRGTQHLLRRKH